MKHIIFKLNKPLSKIDILQIWEHFGSNNTVAPRLLDDLTLELLWVNPSQNTKNIHLFAQKFKESFNKQKENTILYVAVFED